MEIHDKIRIMREINQWSQEEMAENWKCLQRVMQKSSAVKVILI